MILPDVNVLVYAYREEAPGHADYKAWLRDAAQTEEPCGLADVVVSGALRIVTNPRIFDAAAPMEHALGFADALLAGPGVVRVAPGPRHWSVFTGLCSTAGVKGDLVPDAWLAALAIESGSALVTADRGFARFPGLRWRHPLEPAGP